MCRLKRAAPHYLLLCEAKSHWVDEKAQGGRWAFVLEEIGSSRRIEVAESETDVTGERLQLLAVVRGLEALEQHSRVTLFTSSRFVGHGIRRHLATWRDNGFRWESFGEMRVIKYRDLWRRVDNAMKFHSVDCRVWQFSQAASWASRAIETQSDPGSRIWENDPEWLSGTEDDRQPAFTSAEPMQPRNVLKRRLMNLETPFSGELALT